MQIMAQINKISIIVFLMLPLSKINPHKIAIGFEIIAAITQIDAIYY